MTRRGFTLFELLIAIALVGALVVAGSRFLSDIVGTRDRIVERLERDAAITAIVEAVERAAFTSVARAPDGGAGISGDALTLRVHGDQLGLDGVLSGDPAIALRTGRLLEVTIGAGGTLSLSETGAGTPMRSRLEQRVFAARFRFHDGDRWNESWDSLEDGLPRAIEIAVWFDRWPAEMIPEWMPDPEQDEFGAEFDEPGADLFGDAFGEDEFAIGNFDDEAAALASDLEGVSVPRPDRRRVVAILDPQPPDADADVELADDDATGAEFDPDATGGAP